MTPRIALRRTIMLAGCAVAALAIAPVHAQDQAGQGADEADDAGNVILVTARRREERALDVPISVSAVSGEALAKSGTLEITEIAQEMPNVTLEVSRGTNTTLSAFIRGVGQQDPVAGFEAGVGLFVAAVSLNRTQAAVPEDRKSVVQEQGVSGRADPGGRRVLQNKKNKTTQH